jgi:hypothetical protein|nr:hypothetical protein [Neorhizobium tomejilense]
MSHVCIRIYPNGSANYTVRDDAGMENWLAYNKRYRPGNTLVVDGEIVPDTGSLDGSELDAIVAFVLDRKLPDGRVRTPSQREWDDQKGEAYFRYPDDAVLVSDRVGMEFVDTLRPLRQPRL